ncbi:hypothetical protein MPTK1_5g12420 [Marchantia polymorpha subsp. ruderalis]|uniref:Uncharacterized protein n=2 Tax=Marchantia polymorpha TaxID=3197 RepID=A0AAF6BHL3_MARPO|nr:hypothetical protein MARPO_0092s0064 [Marchantia polymorpha]BBN11497.1 hypothetical protein Mp_5g12420 [Marchantia polymorpha subsp. ruderalis]|eukprot:PTQ33103.1 hypothetical protein MARPO_0092s0064 [Marchantia polymorpha]
MFKQQHCDLQENFIGVQLKGLDCGPLAYLMITSKTVWTWSLILLVACNRVHSRTLLAADYILLVTLLVMNLERSLMSSFMKYARCLQGIQRHEKFQSRRHWSSVAGQKRI